MGNFFFGLSQLFLTASAIAIFAPQAIAEFNPDLLSPPPETSWLTADESELAQLNNTLEELITQGQGYDPLIFTPQLFNPGGLDALQYKDYLNEEPSITIIASERKYGADGIPYLLVNYVIEGLLDDSVQGQWLQISYEMSCDRWMVSSVNRAYRCWRGEDTANYAGRLCP